MDSVLQICKTVFILIVLGVGALLFSADANRLVLIPVDRMVQRVKNIADNPRMKVLCYPGIVPLHETQPSLPYCCDCLDSPLSWMLLSRNTPVPCTRACECAVLQDVMELFAKYLPLRFHKYSACKARCQCSRFCIGLAVKKWGNFCKWLWPSRHRDAST